MIHSKNGLTNSITEFMKTGGSEYGCRPDK